MELLERNTALEHLRGLLDTVLHGSGRLVFIAGEAGIGKTALVRQFCTTASARADVLLGACDPLSTPTPLGPLADVAPALGTEVADLLREGAPSRTIFRALLDRLTTPARPRVVVIEDVHWADDATLDLLRFLARRVQGTRALLIATYRSDEVGARHPLRVVLGDIASADVTHLELPGLSQQAVAELARGSGLDPYVLHQRTGGNPFFVSQILATPSTSVPVTVRDAMLARIARLAPVAHTTLEAAAMTGARVDPRLLERIIAADPDGLDACVEAGLLVTERANLAFRHELLREAVVAMIPAHRQMVLHGLILRAIVDSGVHDDLLARLAHHAEGAGDPEAVLRFAPAAARRAARLGAHREAAAQYARALRWSDRLDSTGRADLLEGYGLAAYRVDQTAEAADARRAAADIWRALGDAEREGDNLRWLSRAAWMAGNNAEAEQASRQALDALRALPRSESLAWALCNHAHLRVLTGDYASAWETAEKAVRLGRELGLPEVVAHARLTHGQAGRGLGDDAALVEVEEVLRESLRRNSADMAARAYAILGSTRVHRHELAGADAFMRQALVYIREHDLRVYEHYLMGWVALLHLLHSEWDSAVEIAEAILGSADHSTYNRINALLVLGLVRARRGAPMPWVPLDEALELASRTGELQHVVPVRAARAEVAWLARNAESAVAEARPAFDLAMRKGNIWYAAEPAAWLARAGQPPPGSPIFPAPYALELAGDWTGAAEQWQQRGCSYHRARALAETKDVALLREAQRIAEDLGALPLASQIVDRLRELGWRPASPRRSLAASDPSVPAMLAQFRPREREVIVLLAQACTNREIAERMVISERTAENHVQNVLNRLGLRSRLQIAAWAVHNGIGSASVEYHD